MIPLDATTWPDFAGLVERNNGVWGGCWCLNFHEDGAPGIHPPGERRRLKETRVREGRAHAALVYGGTACVGWCQFGPGFWTFIPFVFLGLLRGSHFATCEALSVADGVDKAAESRLETARRKIVDCDSRLAKYRSDLEAGADVATVAGWMASGTGRAAPGRD